MTKVFKKLIYAGTITFVFLVGVMIAARLGLLEFLPFASRGALVVGLVILLFLTLAGIVASAGMAIAITSVDRVQRGRAATTA
jgi:hypothetical protein